MPRWLSGTSLRPLFEKLSVQIRLKIDFSQKSPLLARVQVHD